MLAMKMTKKKDFFCNLKNRIKALSGNKIEVGYFKALGYHENNRGTEQEDILYTNLAAILFGGSSENNIPARPVFQIGMAIKPLESNKNVKNLLNRYFKDINRKTPRIKAQTVLEGIGGEYVDVFRSIFGNTTLLERNAEYTVNLKTQMGAPYATSPLMEWGDLRAKMSYRINNKLVTPK